ncbi:MAG TPA: GNAT family N-acetyltransferase [Candidatus Caccousia stercoris]|uniref:GNAT family N-acetyltransferase n=1 Tax=Candidatus Caccousia stercoris TaxID=2840723 RepID=A0A9D1K3S5_9FIRM|nr:GNAT family N-acetyltransferase [Candidatus Caccousia stercoris]
MTTIVSIDPCHPGAYAPLLAGSLPTGERGVPVALGCEESGCARAALVAFCVAEDVIIRRVSVDGTCRRRGMGTALVQALCRAAAASGVRRAEAYVSPSEQDQGQEAACSLFRACGFEEEESALVCTVPLSVLTSGPLGGSAPRQAIPLETVPTYKLRAFQASYVRAGRGAELPDLRGLLGRESMVWLENGEIQGCVLLAPSGQNVEILWLYASGAQAVRGLLSAACRALSRSFPPKTLVRAATLLPSEIELMRKLGGESFRQESAICVFTRQLQAEEAAGA